MGMGYGANYADTVSEKFLKKTFPKEFEAFDNAVDASEDDSESVARAIVCGDELDAKVEKAYNTLCKAFEKEYPGATLSIGFHDVEDEGDRYDEVNGVFWVVDGLYQLSPAGKLLKGNFERKMYVSFG